jgi:hypothetical protein
MYCAYSRSRVESLNHYEYTLAGIGSGSKKTQVCLSIFICVCRFFSSVYCVYSRSLVESLNHYERTLAGIGSGSKKTQVWYAPRSEVVVLTLNYSGSFSAQPSD